MTKTFDPKSLRTKCYQWATAILRLLPPEAAHDLAMMFLERRILNIMETSLPKHLSKGLSCEVPGIGLLPHPIGLAAGFDKNARAPHAFAGMGFAFLEIGTVTPRPQTGNSKPRLFRLPDQLGLINRMGFNSDGAMKVKQRLNELKWDHRRAPLGVNLGKNKSTSAVNAIDDYSRGITIFAPHAKYFVINVSSPNTEGLRSLANQAFLQELAIRHPLDLSRMWVKLDPDMPRKHFQDLVGALATCGYAGLILSNTHRVEQPEQGGLSGHPIALQSTACLEWAYEVVGSTLPIIASGGIISGQDVFQRIARGASAVQIYTSLVYRGPLAVALMLQELQDEMKLRGFESLSDVKGSYYLPE